MTLERAGRSRAGLALVALGVMLALALAACGGGADEAEPEAQAPQTPSAEERTPPEAEPAPDEPAPEPDEPAPQEPEPVPEEPAPEPVNGWLRISPAGEFHQLAVDRTGQVIVAAGSGSGIISRDGGASWEPIDWPGERRSRVAIAPGGEQLLVAGLSPLVDEETTAVWSADGGLTWADTGLAIQGADGASATSFLVADVTEGLIEFRGGALVGPTQIPLIEFNFDPADAYVNPSEAQDRYLVSFSEGGTAMLQRTPDGGATSEPFLADFETFGTTRIGFLPFGFVVMSWAGVVLSFDDGATWFPQNAGLEGLEEDGFYLGLVDLVVMPQGSLPILASREDGLFRFSPGGWEPFPGPGVAVGGIEALPGTNALLAVTEEGVFRLENPGTAGE